MNFEEACETVLRWRRYRKTDPDKMKEAINAFGLEMFEPICDVCQHKGACVYEDDGVGRCSFFKEEGLDRT